MKSKIVLILIAFLVSLAVIGIFFVADTSIKPNYNLYYLQKFGGAILTVFSIVLSYIGYDYYKLIKEEEFSVITPVKKENLNMKPSLNGQKCPKCSSKNVILDRNKIYCLDCGEISKMVIK